MWNLFKDKKLAIDSQRNIVHEIANNLRKENKSHEIQEAIQQLNPDELNKKENEARFHLIGLYASHKRQHQEAIEWFTKGLEHVPNSQLIRFSLGQEYIFLKEPKKAFELFDACEFPKLPREYVLQISTYAYLYDQYERGVAYISQFFPYYWDIKNLDEQFLWVRGLPFFSVAWDHLAVHCILGKNTEILNHISDMAKMECQDYDFNYLDAQLNAYINDDSQQLLELTSTRIEEQEKYKINTAQNKIKLICLNLLHMTHYEEGIDLLDSVQCDDGSWLADVRLLAKAVLANKFNMSSQEEEFIKEFLTRQPFLFSPEIALSFGFMPYQEKLKKIIRS